MELVPIIQILSSKVVKWLLKCPLYNFGVKGKKGLATTPIFMCKGQARVYNTDDPYKFELSPTDAVEFNSVRKIKLSHGT